MVYNKGLLNGQHLQVIYSIFLLVFTVGLYVPKNIKVHKARGECQERKYFKKDKLIKERSDPSYTTQCHYKISSTITLFSIL